MLKQRLGRFLLLGVLLTSIGRVAWAQADKAANPSPASPATVIGPAAENFDSKSFSEAYDRVTHSRSAQVQAAGFEQRELSAPIGLGGILLQVVVSLGVVVGLIYGGSYLLRRFASGSMLHSTGPLKVLARQSLSQKSTVYVVSALDRFLIIGENSQGLTCLSEFDDPEENLKLREQWGWELGNSAEKNRLYTPRNSPFGPTLDSHVSELERELQRIKGVSS
jgi:flagellar biogenesis protein FliO